ncbi:MAG: ribosomal protein S18-alanine N-acetyltransferase [Candidatus Marinimicrobia bacterium]|nr:ribosomal protein S18-alanine N-acetyltransferase [Candidatus Neomarinimicrobiota bacterium]
MLIRNAHIDDIDQLISIEEYCYSIPWSRESFEEELTDNELGIGLVAEDEGIVAGFALGIVVAGELQLHNIAVHPDHRGKGLARALMESVEEHCRANDLQRVFLEVRRDNEIANRLYQSLGFQSVGMRKDYYGPDQDANLYTKEL